MSDLSDESSLTSHHSNPKVHIPTEDYPPEGGTDLDSAAGLIVTEEEPLTEEENKENEQQNIPVSLDKLIPEEEVNSEASQISSTRAVEDGVPVDKSEEHHSISTKGGGGMLPPQLPDTINSTNPAAINPNASEEVPPTSTIIVHNRLPVKSQGVSRQMSRASVNTSQFTPRLPGLTQGQRNQKGGLKRADGAMGSIDLNRSVMESLVSSETGRQKSPDQTRDGRWPSPKRPRVPPRFVKVSKVALTTRYKSSSAPPQMSYHDVIHNPLSSIPIGTKPSKIISWDEANNARPPLRIDMEGPTPWTYTPRNKPLYETNSPMHSFGRRTFVEKDAGSRTSWSKTWFQSKDKEIWTQKVDFHSDQTWPTPNKFKQKTSLGPKQATGLGFPAYSCGIRRENTLNKKGSEIEPAPGDYNPSIADGLQRIRAPAYSHGHRRGGTVAWLSTGLDYVPGPGRYNPSKRSIKPHNPNFSIRSHRTKIDHEFGPFACF